MKTINVKGLDIVFCEKGEYSNKLKLAMFLAVYWIWCFSFFIAAVIRIVDGAGLEAVGSGVINLMCLFLCAIWIEDLFNENNA